MTTDFLLGPFPFILVFTFGSQTVMGLASGWALREAVAGGFIVAVTMGLLAVSFIVPAFGLVDLLLWAGWTQREATELMFVLFFPMVAVGMGVFLGLLNLLCWAVEAIDGNGVAPMSDNGKRDDAIEQAREQTRQMFERGEPLPEGVRRYWEQRLSKGAPR
jgi:hypothetical protein